MSPMSMPDLAQVLFSTPLQVSDHPTATQIRAAIDERLRGCVGDQTFCAACVAQEAGDHPEQYAARMRWALRAVQEAYDAPIAA